MEVSQLYIILLVGSILFILYWISKRRVLKKSIELVANRNINRFSELEAIAGGEYIATSQLKEWEENNVQIKQQYLSQYQQRLLLKSIRDKYRKAEEALQNPREWADNYNLEFVEKRVKEMSSWFDSVMDRPFTLAQRKAIVNDENTNLILAAAGTGKTTTILGKVAYILECNLAIPSEILVMAFNKKIATEVKESLIEMGIHDVEVATFHSKGYSILGKVEERKKAISSLTENDSARIKLHQECLSNNLKDQVFFSILKRWFVDLAVDTNRIASSSYDERIRKEWSLGLKSISGILVRSQSELKVADWLTLNGIRWEYEKVYPAPPSPIYRDYTPDFYLPDHKVWLEVWGCDHDGNMAPHIDAKKYQESMTWKRQLHHKQESVLLEIYQDEIWSGKLEELLTNKLLKKRVKSRPLSTEDRLKLLDTGEEVFNRFVILVDSFLNLFRGGAWTEKKILKRIKSERDHAFLKLFLPFLHNYLDILAKEEKIDFHEMLIKGRDHLKVGRYQQAYKYIVVDEFQDTSRLRLDLVRELRDQLLHSRVMLVGDDWQSIYRFAGTDLSIFSELEKHMGGFAQIDLDMTFRLNESILNVSSKFIMKNPAQLKKQLKPRPQSIKKQGVCISYYEKDQEKEMLKAMLYLIADQLEPSARILILGRYRHSFNNLDEQIISTIEEMGFKLELATIHSAKGLEADAVLVLDLGSGTYGFPSEIMDDPVLHLLLSTPDNFPNAEERRLFYVALTRTKNRIYLLVPAQRPSAFIQELLEPEYEGDIETIGEHSERYRCPICFGRTIRIRSGAYGTFWACLNFPSCKGRLTGCNNCDGAYEPQLEAEIITHFSCIECNDETQVCPKCSNGPLVERNGKYGLFHACGNWRKNDPDSCQYTKSK